MIDGVEAVRKLTMATARLSGMTALARPFFSGIGAILMLHRVSAAPPKPLGLNSHLCIRPDFLDAVLGDMRRQGYRFVSMDEAIRLIADPDDGPPFAAITLDDGYRDNLEEALPVFEKYQAPFTIYIAPGLIGGAVDLWWEIIEDVVTAGDAVEVGAPGHAIVLPTRTPPEKARAFRSLLNHLTQEVSETEQPAVVARLAGEPRAKALIAETRSLLMHWGEVATIAEHPLATIGAHTVNHVALRCLPEADARREMDEAASIIEQRLGKRPRHMAYPYGYAAAVGEREAGLAAELGFASAVTTRHGLLHARHIAHLHALPRISLNGRYQSLPYVRTMLSGLTSAIANRGRRVVTM